MILENIPLKPHSNYMIGGVARYFCAASGLHEMSHAIRFSQEKNLPLFILGGGTNVLFHDKGFDGLVLKPEIRFISCVEALPETVSVTVGAGTPVADLLSFCAHHGYSGLEWAGGLPGTVGGAIRGNAGAFGGEMKDSVTEVVSMDTKSEGAHITARENAECGFGYRSSIFKKPETGEIILAVTFSLVRGAPDAVHTAMQSKIAWREARQPLDYPNVGSIFKNVPWEQMPAELREREDIKKHIKTDPFPVIPAAFLIDQAGMKGVTCGGAMVSQKHPNFIVNAGVAEAAHVRELIELVKSEVHSKFGITLEEEIEFA